MSRFTWPWSQCFRARRKITKKKILTCIAVGNQFSELRTITYNDVPLFRSQFALIPKEALLSLAWLTSVRFTYSNCCHWLNLYADRLFVLVFLFLSQEERIAISKLKIMKKVCKIFTSFAISSSELLGKPKKNQKEIINSMKKNPFLIFYLLLLTYYYNFFSTSLLFHAIPWLIG